MKLAQDIKSHPWLFAGLSGLPVAFQSAFVIWFAFAPKMDLTSRATGIPDYAWTAAFACLPLLSGIVGLGVAWILALGLARRPNFADVRLAKVYSGCFVIAWVVCFGYLSFFTFAMGLGTPPAPTSTEQFIGRFAMILWQFPIAIAISVAVCTGVCAVCILVCETLARLLRLKKT